MKNLITLSLAVMCYAASMAQTAGIRLNTLADLDVTATAVQFKNVATGQYIIYKNDPRGGGVLECGPNPEGTPWYFYQAAGAAAGNVEIKRVGAPMFNVSVYDTKTDATTNVVYNHAKRLPNNTTPAAPHDLVIEDAGNGTFRIKFRQNSEYFTWVNVPSFLKDSKGPKISVQPLDANNKNQLWTIYADKSKSAGGGDEFAGHWYRLKTQFRGNGECLEGNQATSKVHNGAAFMDKQQEVGGQLWKLEKQPNGFYLIKNQFRGDNECLEGNQASSSVHDGAAFMDKCRNVSGQYWKVTKEGNYYRFETQFRGNGECLESNQAASSLHAGGAFMDKKQNVSGQLWIVEMVK